MKIQPKHTTAKPSQAKPSQAKPSQAYKPKQGQADVESYKSLVDRNDKRLVALFKEHREHLDKKARKQPFGRDQMDAIWQKIDKEEGKA